MRRSLARAGPIFLLCTLIALLPARGLHAQPGAFPSPQVVRIAFSSPEEVQALAAALDVWHVEREAGYVVALVMPEDWEWLHAQGYDVAVDETLSASLAAVSGYPCYRTMDEVYADLEDLQAEHGDIVQVYTIGYSYEGRPLAVARLTNRAIPGDKPVLFVMGGIHGRELITVEVVVAFAEDLAGRYGVDPDATWILDHHEVHLLVSANPDGHARNETSAAYWRKNTHPYGVCTYYGVDLNRNHTFKWNACEGCSSDNPCDWSYRGPAPGSEPETRAIEAYVRALFADQRGPEDTDAAPLTTPGAFLTLHAYGNEVMWPWGWTSTPSPNADGLAALARKLTRTNGYSAIPSWQLYYTDGTSDDWAYGTLGVAALTFEIGSSTDGMYPPCSRYDALVGPNLDALFYVARAARAPYMQSNGPDALAPSAEPAAVQAGALVTLTAHINDSATGGEAIAAAEYAVDVPWWQGGEAGTMVAVDGDLDADIEEISTVIDTVGWAPGRHTIWVRGRDAGGNWGPPAAAWVVVEGDAAVSGRVTEADGGEALAWTRVRVENGAGVVETTADAEGQYSVVLSSGTYAVSAEARGYAAGSVGGLSVTAGVTATADLSLEPLPLGVLAGRVRAGSSGDPRAVSLAVAGTPVTTTATSGSTYVLPLPAGSYTVTAATAGYARQTATDLAVTAGRITTRDLDLAVVPPLLVVDDDYAGDWLRYDRDAWHAAALDALGLDYDVWPVKEWGSPSAADLAPYGTVLWQTGDARYDTLTSREQEALRGYLEAGGALLLSGQHVAGDIATDPSLFLRSALGADHLGTGPSSGAIAGAGPLEGLTVTIGGGDGAENVVAPAALGAATGAVVAARHADGRGAAVAMEGDGYRALLLGFGVEGVATAAEREALLGAGLAWLGAPVAADGLTLRAEGPTGPVAPGEAVQYAFTLTNATAVSQTAIVITDVVPIELEVASATPPATLSDGVLRWEGLTLLPAGVLEASFTGRLRDDATPGATVLNDAYGATADQGAARRLTGAVRTSIAPAYGASFCAQANLANGWIGEAALVTLALVNGGLTADTYDLTASGGPWPATLPVSQVNLAPGEGVVLVVRADVPEGTAEGETGVYTVRARSTGDAGSGEKVVVAVKAEVARRRAWIPVVYRR